MPLAVEKTLGPVQVITYLGLEIDTVSQQVRVPAVKVDALCNKIHAALCKKKLSLVDLQSLVGSLNFVCRAVSPGRAFLRQLIALSRGLSKPHHRVRVSKGAGKAGLAYVARVLGTLQWGVPNFGQCMG